MPVSVQIDVCAMSQQIGSGKSSLIEAVFKVDMTVRIYSSICLRPITQLCDGNKTARETTHVDVEFHPADNRYLIVHEYSLDSLAGGSLNLQTILDFISSRNRSNSKDSEQLR